MLTCALNDGAIKEINNHRLILMSCSARLIPKYEIGFTLRSVAYLACIEFALKYRRNFVYNNARKLRCRRTAEANLVNSLIAKVELTSRYCVVTQIYLYIKEIFSSPGYTYMYISSPRFPLLHAISLRHSLRSSNDNDFFSDNIYRYLFIPIAWKSSILPLYENI